MTRKPLRTTTLSPDPASHPALIEERRRMLDARLLAVQQAPTRICNASSHATYSGADVAAPSLRPGAMHAYTLPSRTAAGLVWATRHMAGTTKAEA